MDEIQQVKGCCPLDCQDSCAWIADVVDGRVTQVLGDRDHPFTRGVLCAKVKDYEARTYAPDRLLTPLKRSGPKGAGQFTDITWDQAIDEIADRFSDIVTRHGAEALMPMAYLGSMGVVQRLALLRVFHALGASRTHGEVCGASTGALGDDGFPIGFDPEDFAESRLILLWGANILSTCHHHWHFMQEARKNHGARIVSIDPRRTRTAAASDEHISIRPGTDAVLAAAMAHTIATEGLADLDYARSVATDFDAYLADIMRWDADRAAEVCGVPPDTIRRLARELAQTRPAAIRCGVGPQQHARGEVFLRSVAALSILAGQGRETGGGLFIMSFPDLDEAVAARPDLAVGTPRSLDMAALGRHLNDPALDPPVKGMMVWCTNPAVIQTDAALVRKGLARDDLFLVVLEHFMTDTARYADIVLPSTTQLEHFDLQGAWGHHYISVNNPAIAPCGQARSNGEVMRRLAARLGLNHPALQEDDEQIASSALPADVSMDDLKARGWIKRSPADHRPGDDGIRLPLCAGVDRLDWEAPEKFQLLTPKAHYFLNSSFANMARHRQAEVRPTLDMHPDDARAQGLVDGNQVIVSNDQGAIHVHLRIADTVHPGVVVLPGKWWSEPGATGAVANLLAPAAWSPYGQPAYNDIFVDIAAAR